MNNPHQKNPNFDFYSFSLGTERASGPRLNNAETLPPLSSDTTPISVAALLALSPTLASSLLYSEISPRADDQTSGERPVELESASKSHTSVLTSPSA